MEGVVLVECDIEAGAEAIEREGVVFSGEMTGKVDGSCVRDCL